VINEKKDGLKRKVKVQKKREGSKGKGRFKRKP
jgi:hypothetical protein